jgi:hypothetical protein
LVPEEKLLALLKGKRQEEGNHGVMSQRDNSPGYVLGYGKFSFKGHFMV